MFEMGLKVRVSKFSVVANDKRLSVVAVPIFRYK